MPQTSPLIYQKALLSQELKEIFDNAPKDPTEDILVRFLSLTISLPRLVCSSNHILFFRYQGWWCSQRKVSRDYWWKNSTSQETKKWYKKADSSWRSLVQKRIPFLKKCSIVVFHFVNIWIVPFVMKTWVKKKILFGARHVVERVSIAFVLNNGQNKNKIVMNLYIGRSLIYFTLFWLFYFEFLNLFGRNIVC